MIEKAMKDIHYSVKPNRNSKQQVIIDVYQFTGQSLVHLFLIFLGT